MQSPLYLHCREDSLFGFMYFAIGVAFYSFAAKIGIIFQIRNILWQKKAKEDVIWKKCPGMTLKWFVMVGISETYSACLSLLNI